MKYLFAVVVMLISAPVFADTVCGRLSLYSPNSEEIPPMIAFADVSGQSYGFDVSSAANPSMILEGISNNIDHRVCFTGEHGSDRIIHVTQLSVPKT